MKRIANIMLALIVSLTFSSLGATKGNTLIGKWNTEIDGQKAVFFFGDDSQLLLSITGFEEGIEMNLTIDGTYTRNGQILNINLNKDSFQIHIVGNTPQANMLRSMIETPEMRKSLAKELDDDLADKLEIVSLQGNKLVLNDGETTLTLTRE